MRSGLLLEWTLMTVLRRPSLLALCLLLCFLMRTSVGQEEPVPADVGAALDELRAAAGHERPEKRNALVAMGDSAVDGLIGEVSKFRQTADANFIAHCILALGELKAERATDTLVDALSSVNLEIAYAACSALGTIWEGRGGSDEATQRVNVALLALLHSDVPPATLYGPSLALIKVNNIPSKRPTGKTPEDLKAEVVTWISGNVSLPPATEQPWPLNLHTLVTGDDESSRQEAAQALRQKRLLEPVEGILAALARAQELPGSAGDLLAQLLGELTGIPYPPEGADSGLDDSQLVRYWRSLWFEKLREQTEARYVKYAWGELENSLRQYEAAPSQEGADRVKFFRMVLIYQLPDRRALPQSASGKARNLLAEALSVKKNLDDAVGAIEQQPGSWDKLTQLSTIGENVADTTGQEIGILFLGRLAQLAWNEIDQNVARRMGRVLTKISGIPIDLDRTKLETRHRNLRTWAQAVRAMGLPLEFSPE